MSSEPQGNPEPNSAPVDASSTGGVEPLPSAAEPAPLPSAAPATVPISTAGEKKPKLTIKPPPKKKWNPPAPSTPLNRLAWKLVFGATILAMLLLGVIVILLIQTNSPSPNKAPELAEEFRDTASNSYAIRPPLNWILQDPHDGRNFFIKGPRESGYIPLMIICVDVAPGRLDSYMKEYKGRQQAEDPSIKFDEESTLKVDGFDASRLVYTWTSPNTDGSQTKVKSVQYIVCDAPRFYRVTCSVREDLFDKYLPRFEASAKTFKILPLPETKVPGF